MGVTKSASFNRTQNEIARFAKAFANPARVAIIEILLESKTCICNDLVTQLPLAQSTISMHLKELKEIGVIKGEVEGAKLNYCIDVENWHKIQQAFSGLFEQLSDRGEQQLCEV